MLDQLLKYYKSKVTAYGLVFKNMKLLYNTTIFFVAFTSMYLLVIALSAVLNLAFQFVEVVFSYYFLGGLVCLFIITAIFLSLLNRRAKIILKEKYEITVKEKTWRNYEFSRLQISNIMKYLTHNKLNSVDKINQLINNLNKEIERKKFPSLIVPGIFISLSLPVWIQFLGIIFKDIDRGMEAFFLMLAIVFIVIIGIGFISFVKWTIEQLLDVLFISEISLMKHLIEKLEESLLIEFVD